MVETETYNSEIIVGQGAVLIEYKTAYKAKQPVHSNPKEDESKNNSADEVAFWGSNNQFPQEVIENAKKSTVILPTLDLKARMLYALGLIYGYISKKGKFKRLYIKEIEDFISHSNLKRFYLKNASEDYYTLLAVFPEILLSRDRTKITSVRTIDAAKCRLEKQNSKGEIKNIFVSANWDTNPDDKKKIPLLDIWGDTVELLRQKKGYKFIYPLLQPDSGQTYYPSPIWHTAVRSKWYDVALNIPAFKKALMENQMSIKYLIEVPEYYWKDTIDNWEKLDFNKQKEEKSKWLKAIEEALTGNEKAGKSILSSFKYNGFEKEIIPSIKITVIDNKIKDGIYITDGESANLHLLYALGVPSALLGNALSKSSQGAGSGSDVREHINNYQSFIKPHEETILEPLEFIAQFNGWNERVGKKIVFQFKRTEMQTLDKISPDKREPKPKES